MLYPLKLAKKVFDFFHFSYSRFGLFLAIELICNALLAFAFINILLRGCILIILLRGCILIILLRGCILIVSKIDLT